jgi:tetratricopeptide (TPR) repeat protein
MLQQAQEKLRHGESEEASRLLMDAAQAYEAVGRHDNAGTIYRSLGKSPTTPPAVLELWLANCERREDKREASTVACELGDRAIQLGNVDSAHLWFDRARQLDENNPLALRRLQRLAAMKDGVGPPQLVSADAVETGPPALEPAAMAPAPFAPPPVAPPTPEPVTMQAPPAAPTPVAPPSPPEHVNDRVELAVGRSEAVTFDSRSTAFRVPARHRGPAFRRRPGALRSGHGVPRDGPAGSRGRIVPHGGAASGSLAARDRDARPLHAGPGAIRRSGRRAGGRARAPGSDAEGSLSLRYLLALAYEAAGRPREALAELEKVFAVQPNYHDVAPKLRDLRKALGSA